MGNRNLKGPLDEFTRRPLLRVAVWCADLAAARVFYEDTLGSRLVSQEPDLLVFDFFGGRLYVQLDDAPSDASASAPANARKPEIGLETGWEDWHRAVDHLNYVGVSYASPPTLRDRGTPQELAHFSIEDPGGNRLGFTSRRE